MGPTGPWGRQAEDGNASVRVNSRFDPTPLSCSAPHCGSLATIIHDDKPYCGKHALDALEAKESRPAARPSVADPEAATDEPKECGSDKSKLKAGPGEPQSFVQIGDQKEKAG